MIDRKVQLTILVYTIIVAVLVTLMDELFLKISTQPYAADDIGSVIFSAWAYFCGCVLLAVALIIVNFELSNRIAGPIYRLKAHMDAVADGKMPDDVAFRKGDQFKEVAISYNRLLQFLRRSQNSPGHMPQVPDMSDKS
jgi:HAMP domain-containing protein